MSSPHDYPDQWTRFGTVRFCSGEGCAIWYHQDTNGFSFSNQCYEYSTSYEYGEMLYDDKAYSQLEEFANKLVKHYDQCCYEIEEEETFVPQPQLPPKENEMSRKNYHAVTPENRLIAFRALLEKGQIAIDEDSQSREEALYATLADLCDDGLVSKDGKWFRLNSQGQQVAERTGLIQFASENPVDVEPKKVG